MTDSVSFDSCSGPEVDGHVYYNGFKVPEHDCDCDLDSELAGRCATWSIVIPSED